MAGPHDYDVIPRALMRVHKAQSWVKYEQERNNTCYCIYSHFWQWLSHEIPQHDVPWLLKCMRYLYGLQRPCISHISSMDTCCYWFDDMCNIFFYYVCFNYRELANYHLQISAEQSPLTFLWKPKYEFYLIVLSYENENVNSICTPASVGSFRQWQRA